MTPKAPPRHRCFLPRAWRPREAESIKESSRKRYDSLFTVHFGVWLDRPVSNLCQPEFTMHCQTFARSRGAALVELGRGVMGAVLKYANATDGCDLASQFTKLATIGLMPDRAQPRARVLRESDLPAWKRAVDQFPERRRDFLLLVLYTGLRLAEARWLLRSQIDLAGGVLSVPMTKNGKPHCLPITPLMRELLERRCAGLRPDEELFGGVAAGHLSKMMARFGSPAFMLHDLRKLLATVGERLGLGDAVLRRLLNHTPPKSDVLHRHYVNLTVEDVREPLELIQAHLAGMLDQT